MTMDTNRHARDLLNKAKNSLQFHHLSQAESLFLDALKCLPTDEKNIYAYEAYHSLAQIYTKRGRLCQNDEKEWHRFYLQAICMNIQAVRLAPSKIHAQRVHKELVAVQEIYCRCLQTRLFPLPQPKSSCGQYSQLKNFPKMDTRWLQELKEHIRVQLGSTTKYSRESVSSEESIQEEATEPQTEEHNKRKVDFNRVRKAIMRMVKQISMDMRSRYIHKHLSEDTLRQAVSSEMMCMLTPENENTDVISLFESFLVEAHTESELEQSQNETDQRTFSAESECNDRTPIYNVPARANIPLYSISERHFVPHRVHATNETTNSVNSAVQLDGILRIWRGYDNNQHQPTIFVPHKLNFEESSPVTETPRYSFKNIQKQKSTADVLSKQKIDTTLAASLSKVADKLCANNKYPPADELYTHALGIYQRYETYIPAYEASMIAHILNSVGKLRCRKGDMIGGVYLMQKSVDMYQKCHGQREHVDIVSVWYELGKAYMYEQCQSDNLLDHIMEAVKNKMDLIKGGTENNDDKSTDYVSDSDYDSDDNNEDSYMLNIHEAISCLNHALKMLHNLRQTKHKLYSAVYVKVLVKLADCCVILGDYYKATLCYEEALILFPNIVDSSVLDLNAHALTVLGATNFLLGSYLKAVRILETAHILQQHISKTEMSFSKAFTLTMLGIANHAARHYHKCVAWCLNAHDMYVKMYPNLSKQTAIKCWFVVINVYMLGYAYNFVNLKEQALCYLNLSHEMVLSTLQDDDSQTEQVVHILKLIADVHVKKGNHQEALEHYEKAHAYAHKLGDGQRSSTLHNQLFNSMAALHVTNKDYSTAAQCLEQALDYQENLQDSIKGDMFDMLLSLGLTYTFSGDIDKAIDCYKEAMEAYQDMHRDRPGPEISGILGRLATLYHVKMCLEEDENDVIALAKLSEQYYREACKLDPYSPIVIQLANFQYQQSQTHDALLTMLDFLQHSTITSSPDVVYNGPEQAVLPTHMQYDVDDMDEVILNAKVFGYFLVVLCFKELNLIKDAEDSLVALYKLVYQCSAATGFSMLGYALMEMDLMEEATEVFAIAFNLDTETVNSLVNVWLCLVTRVYRVLCKALIVVMETISPQYGIVSAEKCELEASSFKSSSSSLNMEPPIAQQNLNPNFRVKQNSSYSISTALSPKSIELDQNYDIKSSSPTTTGNHKFETSLEKQKQSEWSVHINNQETPGSFDKRSHSQRLVATHISPDEVSRHNDIWHEDQNIEKDNTSALDDLLKTSQDLEAELEECLQHLNSRKSQDYSTTGWGTGLNTWTFEHASSPQKNPQKEHDSDTGGRTSSRSSSKSKATKDSTPAYTGWRAATSSRTQDILMSIQNNNLASKCSVPVEEINYHREPFHVNGMASEWKVCEEGEIIKTPLELLEVSFESQKPNGLFENVDNEYLERQDKEVGW